MVTEEATPEQVHTGTRIFSGTTSAEQRHRDGGAESGAAAQRVGRDDHDGAVGDLESGEGGNGWTLTRGRTGE